MSNSDINDQYKDRLINFIFGREVQGMLDTEYNEAEVMELFAIEGEKKGVDKHLIGLICKKLVKGKTSDVIADEVEENIDVVNAIVDIAKDFIPDYNVDKIYDEWMNKKNV